MSKISQQTIDAVLQPIGSAKGLPNAAYVDDQAFLHDRDAVLSASWAGIAFGSELPEPGYAKPLNFMGLPLLAVRNKSGEINVFHNVCSHRGMLLVAEEQPIKTVIRCRYHSWAYDLDGALRATPHIGGVDKHECAGFNRDGHGLKLVRSVLWMDVIFVNLSGDAPSFDEFIAPARSCHGSGASRALLSLPSKFHADARSPHDDRRLADQTNDVRSGRRWLR
jgi:choline monooxygenase